MTKYTPIRAKRVAKKITSAIGTILVLSGLSLCYGHSNRHAQWVARCVQRAYHRGECIDGIQDVCEAKWLLRDGIEEIAP